MKGPRIVHREGAKDAKKRQERQGSGFVSARGALEAREHFAGERAGLSQPLGIRIRAAEADPDHGFSAQYVQSGGDSIRYPKRLIADTLKRARL